MLAVIGGTGLTEFEHLTLTDEKNLDTPYGATSAPIKVGTLESQPICFLARHGHPHTIPPHKINYCANIHALKQIGVTEIIAVAAVGGIHSDMVPGGICIPDQIIDYTYGRKATFFEDGLQEVVHVDFSFPYAERMRNRLLQVARDRAVACVDHGTYGATQGPRLETAAEIARMKRDGCDIVGMTGMPEAALARELELDYAAIAVNANWAAGITDDIITMEDVYANLAVGMDRVKRLIQSYVCG